MKTLLIIAMLFSATPSHAEQMVLSKGSEAEALTFLFLMCPTCVVAHLANGSKEKPKEEPKKKPDYKNKESVVERTLASEPKKVSK